MSETKQFTTNDGVQLQYLEAGAGKPLVLIPGWSQTALQFKHQIDAMSATQRVIALDMRGHGESAKPATGYTIHRLAKDVHELLTALELQEVTLLGHSMGCSVIWGYLQLFGDERLAKLVLVDQSPFLTANPLWTDEERAAAGSLFTPEAALATCNALAGPDGDATTRGFIAGMLTSACPPDVKEWIIERNFTMPRQHAATLLYNHCGQDWRGLIPTIRLPTLVVGGRVSLVPWTSVAWTAAQIPGARLEIFEEHEGGQHFMFIENPEKFNQILAAFL